MPNGRCRMHGGTNPGAPKGNTNGIRHGIYAKALRPDELEEWEHIEVDGLDDEIRLVKIQLVRAQIEINKLDSPPEESALPVVEIREDENDKSHVTRVRRAPDLPALCAIRDRLILRLAQLLRTKALLRNLGMGGTKSAEDLARDIRESLSRMEDLSDGGIAGEVDPSLDPE